MRKLSEISGTEGIKAIGAMLPTIEKMIKKNGEMGKRSPLEYIGDMLKNAPEDTILLFATIDGVPAEVYEKKSFLELMKDITDMVNDEELISLFGLQRQTQTSSTSA